MTRHLRGYLIALLALMSQIAVARVSDLPEPLPKDSTPWYGIGRHVKVKSGAMVLDQHNHPIGIGEDRILKVTGLTCDDSGRTRLCLDSFICANTDDVTPAFFKGVQVKITDEGNLYRTAGGELINPQPESRYFVIGESRLNCQVEWLVQGSMSEIWVKADDVRPYHRIEIATERIRQGRGANWLDFFERGRIWSELHEWDLSILDFTEALRLNPWGADVYVDRAKSYIHRPHSDHFSRALGDGFEAVRLAPGNAEAYYVRGRAFRGLRRYDRALSDFNEAIRLDPQHPDAASERANLIGGKKVKDAIDDLAEAVKASKAELAEAVKAATKAVDEKVTMAKVEVDAKVTTAKEDVDAKVSTATGKLQDVTDAIRELDAKVKEAEVKLANLAAAPISFSLKSDKITIAYSFDPGKPGEPPVLKFNPDKSSTKTVEVLLKTSAVTFPETIKATMDFDIAGNSHLKPFDVYGRWAADTSTYAVPVEKIAEELNKTAARLYTPGTVKSIVTKSIHVTPEPLPRAVFVNGDTDNQLTVTFEFYANN